MIRALLIRGMLVGALAGLMSFAVARMIGEPQIDRAIAFEEQMASAGHQHADAATNTMSMAPHSDEELVSRSTQSGIGLLTALAVYGAAFGGVFAVVFAFVHGRFGQ